jgi:hypothetical protein
MKKTLQPLHKDLNSLFDGPNSSSIGYLAPMTKLDAIQVGNCLIHQRNILSFKAELSTTPWSGTVPWPVRLQFLIVPNSLSRSHLSLLQPLRSPSHSRSCHIRLTRFLDVSLANKECSNNITSTSPSLGSHEKYPGPVSSNSYSITAGVSIGFLAAAATTTANQAF